MYNITNNKSTVILKVIKVPNIRLIWRSTMSLLQLVRGQEIEKCQENQKI